MARPLFSTPNILAAGLLLFAGQASGTMEYFVQPHGDDSRDGLTRESAFATVQRGVDALEPGDILTIGPGEYFEGVSRDDLGDDQSDTLIRAEIPGTVILRGDVPAPPFEKVDGFRFVYVADFDAHDTVEAVNELSTRTIMNAQPTVAAVEAIPGSFHYDPEKGKLYPISRIWKIAGRALMLIEWGDGDHIGASRASPGG